MAKKKQETEKVEQTPVNTEVSEKVMKKVDALPEGEKKEMILNFIKDFHLSEMSSKVGYIIKCNSISKSQELINKWTKNNETLEHLL
jgi:hypothetical protein